MPEPETTTTDTETESTEQTSTEKDWKAEAEKWKSQSRKNEQQAKANAEAARRLAEIEESGKSEADKLAQKAADSDTRATAAELKLLKIEVGLEKGLTKDQAQRLVGATREELEEDADELITAFGITDEDDEEEDPAPPERQPREKLRPGRKGAEPLPLNGDPLTDALKKKLGVR
jgi:hypothetical protein